MLFVYVSGEWIFDVNGNHNLQFVEVDAQGTYIRFIGYRVPVQVVCPD